MQPGMSKTGLRQGFKDEQAEMEFADITPEVHTLKGAQMVGQWGAGPSKVAIWINRTCKCNHVRDMWTPIQGLANASRCFGQLMAHLVCIGNAANITVTPAPARVRVATQVSGYP